MKPVSPQFNLPEIETQVLEFWQANSIFEKSLEQRKNSKSYFFYDGPPFSSGSPHYGHLLVGTIKDIIPRYQTMCGFYVERRFGWDTHGLPMEMIAEKELGIKGHKDILKYGVTKFNEYCRANVLSCVKEWEVITNKLGRWVDLKNDYKTMDLDFMESVWWVFKELWDHGRIYEGLRVMPYSWRLSTPLSNFEATSNYKMVQDPAITVRLKLKAKTNTSFLVWTTTPWTLPSNIAACVNPEITYLEIEHNNENLILAESCLKNYFQDNSKYKILSTYKGKDLEGLKYLPLFEFYETKAPSHAFQILADEYVSTETGTGIVHQSPAHGEDDYRIAQKYKLPIFDPVDEEGNFNSETPALKGKNIKAADADIIKMLKDKNLIFKHETVNHSYPFCERSDTPLIYKAISAWYVKVEDLRDEMLSNNKKIHWMPEHIKFGRFGKWLEQARDWNISRNRFWGNPLPVWKCDKCKKIEVLGSVNELEQKSNQKVKDLHKHFVDDLTWKCASCTGTMQRIPEVLDCWFESGAMPYAQLHYPFNNKEKFKNSFPADFITESLDQTRGWFYTLMIHATSLFKQTPFKNCVVTGMILAEDGKKMSKSLKNYPDPMHIINNYGADALRLYLINSPLVRGDSLRFSENGVKDIVRTVLIPYWNVYSFFTTYADTDKYVPNKTLTDSKNILDRWIISRLQSLTKNIKSEMAQYRLYLVVPALLGFLEELTNWYLRRSRRRFWENNPTDKQSGYDTLYFVLQEFTKILAPYLPFMTENMYQNLKAKSAAESVHLLDYPKSADSLINLEIENQMALIQKAVHLGRALRSRVNIKTRQPLRSITVVTKNSSDEKTLATYSDHIKEELNVKQVLFSDKESDLVTLELKPNFPVLGPKLSSKIKELANALTNISDPDIEKLESGKSITLLGEELDSESITVIRKPKNPELEIETSQGVTVFFDTKLDQDLVSEGLARELVNRIQKMRKDANFNISDRINLQLTAKQEFIDKITNFEGYIKDETLALKVNYYVVPSSNSYKYLENHEINDFKVSVAIERDFT